MTIEFVTANVVDAIAETNAPTTMENVRSDVRNVVIGPEVAKPIDQNYRSKLRGNKNDDTTKTDAMYSRNHMGM